MSTRKIALRLALLAPLLWALVAVAESSPPERNGIGPAPKDGDDLFTNWVGDLPHGSLGVRLPFFLRRVGGAFHSRPGIPDRTANDGVFLRENAKHSEPTVTWVGHSTLLVQMDHLTFLTDPIWSDSPSPFSFAGPRRFVDPGIAIVDLPPIDFVLVSHNHYDHLDLPSLRALAERRPETRFFVPLGNAALLRSEGIENVAELDWGNIVVVEGVTIHCLPAQHWSKRNLGDDRATLWASWAVTGEQRKFYFSGDTGYFEGFVRIGEELGPFDLAAVPIGAYEPTAMMKASHMNPEQAIRAAVDLRARHAVAIHFGTFDLSDEPLDEPPRRFREAAVLAASERELDANAGWVLEIGETRHF